MTTLSSTEYFNIRKELREKYFTDDNFTQLSDIRLFRRYLTSNDEHIGEMSEYYFCVEYIINPEQYETLQTKTHFNDTTSLKLILSNPNQYLNPKSNIQAVYDYLQEIKQYNTEGWLMDRVDKILSIFDKHKNNLPISVKIENNQQLWL